MKAEYRGVDGVARKIIKEYRGVSGVAREVTKAYRGVNGVARQFFQRSTPASQLAVGSSVYLNVSGVQTEFLIVHQGLPASFYDSSCNGTWLMRKYVDVFMPISNSGSKFYAVASIHTYLNDTFFGSLDAGVQSIVKQVKIPTYYAYTPLTAKIFLLSGVEVGIPITLSSSVPEDGAKLSFFNSNAYEDDKRIATDSTDFHNTREWWTRSEYDGNSGNYWYIADTGKARHAYSYGSGDTRKKGIRPAMILPSTALFDDQNVIIT